MSPQTRWALIMTGISLAATSFMMAIAGAYAYYAKGLTTTWMALLGAFALMFFLSLIHGIAVYLKELATAPRNPVPQENPQQAAQDAQVRVLEYSFGQVLDIFVNVMEQRCPGIKDMLPIPPVPLPPAQNTPGNPSSNQ